MAFLSEDNFFFLRCKVHSVRYTYLPLALTWVKLSTRHEVSTELTHLLTLMNNGKTFSSLDGVACSYQCPDQFQFLPGHWQAKVLDFLRNQENYWESRYLFCCNYEQSSQNNQCIWYFPLKYESIFSKKSFSWGDKTFFLAKKVKVRLF